LLSCVLPWQRPGATEGWEKVFVPGVKGVLCFIVFVLSVCVSVLLCAEYQSAVDFCTVFISWKNSISPIIGWG